MTIPKPILTIKQKCRECGGNPPMPKITMKLGRIENLTKEQRNRVKNIGNKKEGIVIYEFFAECRCKGTGQQEIKTYALRDFKKCDCICHLDYPQWKGKHATFLRGRLKGSIDCNYCKGTGYIIPKEYEPYEIKKVSEINFDFKESIVKQEFMKINNLKEDDKVVITNA